MLSATAAALLGAACPGRETATAGDDESGDATAGGETTPTTAGPDEDTVIAPVMVTYRPLAAAPVIQPLDPLQRYAEISIVSGGQVFPGVYDGSERLEFAGVPPGPYLLRQQYPAFVLYPGEPGLVYAYVSDERELPLYSEIYSGRPDVAATYDPGTRVTLSASGLQPLGAYDEFEVYSYQADALAYLSPSFHPGDGSNSPPEGATSLDGWTTAWRPDSGRYGWTLPDPGQGDDLWLAHLRGSLLVEAPDAVQAKDPWSYARVSTLTAVAEVTFGAFTPGGTAKVTGVFAPVARETSTFDLRVDKFMGPLSSQAGVVFNTACSIHVFLEPGIPTPVIGMTPTLGQLSVRSKDLLVDPSCQDHECATEYTYFGDRVVELEHANPYSGGVEMAQVSCTTTTSVLHPEIGTNERLRASMVVLGRLDDVTKAPIVPTLGLVEDLRVNGEIAAVDAVTAGVGTTPTVSFAPSLGAVDRYTVTVVSLADLYDIDGVVLDDHTVGSLRTTGTSVTIPDGLMQPGSYYYLRVTAEHGHKATGPLPYTYDLGYATAITGVLTP